MKLSTAFPVMAIACVAVCSTAYALYSVANEGHWPATWPKELEPLRKQSRTLIGPTFSARHYAVHFASREEFESAWPHLLKVKSKGAPIILMRGENFFLDKVIEAGVVVHCPPLGQSDNPKTPEAPITGYTDEQARSRWAWTNYIELVVDGEIVDLNRIPLPADTPIIDERFKDDKAK